MTETQQATQRSRKRTWAFRVVMLAASLGVSLVILEVIFRSQVPRSGRTPMQTSEVEGLPYQLRPEFSTRYFGHDVRINKQGFRGPGCTRTRRRRAARGSGWRLDTFGHVALEDTLAHQLTRQLQAKDKPAQVLNCGVSGYDAAHIAVMLEHQVLEFSPDVVIYICCYNDGPEPGPVARPEISPDQVMDLTKSFPLRSAFLEWGGRRVKALMRMFNMGSSKGYVAGILDIWKDGGSDRFAAAVEKMQTLCADKDVQLFVAFCPPMIHPQSQPVLDRSKRTWSRSASRLNVEFLPLREAFGESENLAKYQVNLYDSHPNGEANQRMATRMAEEF